MSEDHEACGLIDLISSAKWFVFNNGTEREIHIYLTSVTFQRQVYVFYVYTWIYVNLSKSAK